jgi:hypothetical protein
MNSLNNNNDMPLPLKVATHWNFSLAFVETDEDIYYAVQDWLRGILIKDVRQIWSHIRKQRTEIDKLIKYFPYTTTNKKTYRIPYVNELGLMLLLASLRLSAGRNRLVTIRNFVASLSPEYEYLKCSSVSEKRHKESDFQSSLVRVLNSNFSISELIEYYITPLGRKIDILLIKNCASVHPLQKPQVILLVECKTEIKEFYKAIGQLNCYKAELSQGLFDTSTMSLAIAMPYNIIDEYVRNTARNLPILLLSVVDNTLIDAITGEPFLPERW